MVALRDSNFRVQDISFVKMRVFHFDYDHLNVNKKCTITICLDEKIRNYREVVILSNSNTSIKFLLFLNIYALMEAGPTQHYVV